MVFPDLSNSMKVAQLRYIQTIHEQGERRNPDTLVRHFIPLIERMRSQWIGRGRLRDLRASPFYYYLVARTKYYDAVVEEAIASGVRNIMGVGCGSDTRAHRFDELMRNHAVNVLECDQPESIRAKQAIARRLPGKGHVEYLAVDLNHGPWHELERRIKERSAQKTLVMMEGVSPYIHAGVFEKFLDLLSRLLLPGSEVAYDFKIAGVNDCAGGSGKSDPLFRLLPSSAEVEAFHRKHHLELEHLEFGCGLSARLIPGLGAADGAYAEDVLVRLRVPRN